MRLPRMRFTVRRLIALIVASAVVAAFVRPQAAVCGVGELLILVACAGAITLPLALAQDGRERAIGAGLAYCGWIYLLVSLGFGPDPDMAPLPTSRILDHLYKTLCVRPPEGCIVMAPVLGRETFLRLDHCAMGLLAAGAGGLAGLVLHRLSMAPGARSGLGIEDAQGGP